MGLKFLLLSVIESKFCGDGAVDWVDSPSIAEVDISLENCIGSSNDCSVVIYLIRQRFFNYVNKIFTTLAFSNEQCGTTAAWACVEN